MDKFLLESSTCTLCSYESKSSFLLYQHEQLHATRLKTVFFTCYSKPPEPYACGFCGFETNLKVDLTEHFCVSHGGREEENELKNILKCFYCKNCNFETHSVLVLTNHTIDCNSPKQNGGLLEEVELKNPSKVGVEVNVLSEHSYCRSLNEQQECGQRELDWVKPKSLHKRFESKYKSTPPDLGVVKQILPPDKSKLKYNKAYKTYMDWCARKQATNIGSETVLLAYFAEEAIKKKPSTLFSMYSMVKSTLLINHQIDISLNSKLWCFLKQQNVGYKPKKSRVLLKEEIDRFLEEAPKEFLPQKVALIIGISGACRIDELHRMKLRDIEFLENRISVVISDSETCQSRPFIINNQKWIAIVQEYLNLRKEIENENFFVQVRFGAITNQQFGYKSLEKLPKKIAAYLQLNNVNEYTAHCFKRTAAATYFVAN